MVSAEYNLQEVNLRDEEQTQDVEKGVQSKRQTKTKRSVMKDVREIRQEQVKIGQIISESMYGLIMLSLANILHILCIVVGSIHLRDCRMSPAIPIVLIVNGALNLSINLLDTVKAKINKKNEGLLSTLGCLSCVLKVAVFIALITWIVVIARVDCPDYKHPKENNYCHKTVYKSAYWGLVVTILVAMCTSFCSCLGCMCTTFGEAIDETVKEAVEEKTKNMDKKQKDEQGGGAAPAAVVTSPSRQ